MGDASGDRLFDEFYNKEIDVADDLMAPTVVIDAGAPPEAGSPQLAKGGTTPN
ncbi:MAG: hypothetical protein U0232_27460 [Thermomicrobiales bacterium]